MEIPESIIKYASSNECGGIMCKDESLNEHFHCYDLQCNNRVIIKREELIRHLKWHMKRNNSLKLGFLRFSSSDDCSIQFQTCIYNQKQTHYHCIHSKCSKVYISTSDVQIHSNSHQKDSAIIQEGFQRYRATENCDTNYCTFSQLQTTHFHCVRRNCKHTFKNKADMGMIFFLLFSGENFSRIWL